MAISTILAVASTALPSTDVTLTVGAQARIGLFVASGILPDGVYATVVEITPGSVNRVCTLSAHDPSRLFYGPGVYRVLRPAGLPVAIGVFQDI